MSVWRYRTHGWKVGVWKYSGPERLCEVIGQNTSDWYDSVPSPRRISHAMLAGAI